VLLGVWQLPQELEAERTPPATGWKPVCKTGRHRSLNRKLWNIFRKLCFSAKNWCSFVVDMNKINICGDILESRIFEEYWYFVAQCEAIYNIQILETSSHFWL
jgi:hypothetical protein